jgi:hypothetical protein
MTFPAFETKNEEEILQRESMPDKKGAFVI